MTAFACKQPEPTPPATEPTGSGSAAEAAPPGQSKPPAPAWTANSHPVELACGDQPLKLPSAQPPAKPGADRPLAHGDPIAQCHDQPSADAACGCLAGSIAQWGAGFQLAAPATCQPVPGGKPDAQLVEIEDNPAAPDAKRGGSAFVLIAKRGATWSAISAVDARGDIDLSQTPKLDGKLTLIGFERHPVAAGALYWIETRNETSEADMGAHDLDGGVLGTLCSVPSNASAAAFCYAPIKLANWTYTWTPSSSSCEISKMATFSASLAPAGVTVRIEHGSDADGTSGHYRL